MELLDLRKKLDSIDKEWILVLKKRMDLIPEVAEYKLKNNIKRYQPQREREIIRSRRKTAQEIGLNPNLVEDIIKRVIIESHLIEKEIMGK